MSFIKQIIKKHRDISIPKPKNNFPPCGREYCYCVKTTDLNKKKNLEMYFECYRTWYNYVS